MKIKINSLAEEMLKLQINMDFKSNHSGVWREIIDNPPNNSMEYKD